VPRLLVMTVGEWPQPVRDRFGLKGYRATRALPAERRPPPAFAQHARSSCLGIRFTVEPLANAATSQETQDGAASYSGPALLKHPEAPCVARSRVLLYCRRRFVVAKVRAKWFQQEWR
jgi:hypothetical protein